MYNDSSNYLPLISVITVVYNASNDIEKTILSVINQTYKNIEYIIIDGGSNDGTKSIIERYKSRLKHYVSEPDKGIYDAMNKGIRLSKGSWLNFMNAGDTFYDNRVIDNIISFIPNEKKIKVLYGDVYMVFKGDEGFVKKMNCININQVQFSLNHQSTIIEGRWMRTKEYDTTYRIAADVNFFDQTIREGYIFKYIPLIVSKYESSMGVSAINQMVLFRELMRIKGINKNSFIWLKGNLRARIFSLLHLLPFGFGEFILAYYVKKRVRK